MAHDFRGFSPWLAGSSQQAETFWWKGMVENNCYLIVYGKQEKGKDPEREARDKIHSFSAYP